MSLLPGHFGIAFSQQVFSFNATRGPVKRTKVEGGVEDAKCARVGNLVDREEAADAYMFHTGIQYALNLQPENLSLSSRAGFLSAVSVRGRSAAFCSPDDVIE